MYVTLFRCRAVTLVELQVALILAAIMALMIGILGTISLEASGRARDEANVYSDLRYSLETIQHKVRSAQSLGTGCPAGPGWTAPCLVVDNNIYFGVRSDQETGFAYYKSAAPVESAVLFMINPSVVVDDNIYFGVSVGTTGRDVDVSLSGRRNRIDFDVPNTIKRRAQ